ncbi:MAG: response regulator transcription factor [Anaerolineae bacterium]|nr:response regulator transcription factor [Anaerolineae bacterium]
MSISIVIVDDHVVVRQGLRLLLETQPELRIVGETGDGQEALRLVETLQPDVVLLDLIMPGMSGLDVLRELRRRGVGSRVLVLTSSLEDHIVTQALQAGADGYLLKTSRSSDMLNAIRQVAAGGSALDPAVTTILRQHLAGRDPLDALTPREREVFDLLAHGVSSPQIAEKLVVSEATVRTHITSVLDKLRLRDRTQVMVYALKRGIVRPQDLP